MSKWDYIEFTEMVGQPSQEKADYFEVNKATLKRWMSGKNKIPGWAMKLAKLRYQGELSAIMGKEWDGIRIQGKYLFLPGWRTGFEARELRAHFIKHAARYRLEWDVEILRGDIRRREAEIERLENQVHYLRRQIYLEASMGMMLERITSKA